MRILTVQNFTRDKRAQCVLSARAQTKWRLFYAAWLAIGSISSRFGTPVVILLPTWDGSRNAGSQNGWKKSLFAKRKHKITISRHFLSRGYAGFNTDTSSFSKSSVFPRPQENTKTRFSKNSCSERVFKKLHSFGDRFHRIRVGGIRIRNEKSCVFKRKPGYVWTGP